MVYEQRHNMYILFRLPSTNIGSRNPESQFPIIHISFLLPSFPTVEKEAHSGTSQTSSKHSLVILTPSSTTALGNAKLCPPSPFPLNPINPSSFFLLPPTTFPFPFPTTPFGSNVLSFCPAFVLDWEAELEIVEEDAVEEVAEGF